MEETKKIIELLEKDNPKKALKLIKRNSSLNAYGVGENGDTLLIVASRKGFLEIVQEILKSGPSINAINDGEFALYVASKKGYEEIVEELLACKIFVDQRNKNGETSLFVASKKGHLNIVSRLLRAKANPNLFNNENSALQKASLKARTNIVVELLKFNADVNHQNKGNTSLHFAVMSQNEEIVQILLENNSFVDMKNFKFTPLQIASRLSNINIVQELLNYGASPVVKNIGNSSINLATNPEIKHRLKCYTSYTDDFISLIDETISSDVQIECLDGYINSVSQLIEIRLGIPISNFIEISKKYQKETILKILKWVHGREWELLLESEFEFSNMKKILISMGIEEKRILLNGGRKGLLRDMMKIYEDRKSADFSIFVSGEEIKVHKFVLFCRSELYKGMFLCVQNDKSNQAPDLSGRSFDAVQNLVKFLYFDHLDPNISVNTAEQLLDAVDYYQLNNDSLLSEEVWDKLSNQFDSN